MTIFRVNVDRDEAEVVKRCKQYPDLVQVTKEWNKVVADFRSSIKTQATAAIAASRKVYTLADQKMKEVAKDPAQKDALKAIADVRKSSYELTTTLKAWVD